MNFITIIILPCFFKIKKGFLKPNLELQDTQIQSMMMRL
jgi:hypothetical protein